MKKLPQTVIESLVTRVREQAKRYNPALESAPVAVLWTDERREWEGVLPQLQSALPELFALGSYQPAQRSGPGAWLRMVADGQAGGLPKGMVPLLYLPGVGNGSLRTDLRGLKNDPQLAPIAELQYRGSFWRQENGKDWTLRAFFESKRGGLGLAVKGDQATLAALKQALPRLLSRSLVTLEARQIDLAFLDEILNPNPADDVLRWMADPAGLQGEKGRHLGQASWHPPRPATASTWARVCWTPPPWCWRHARLTRPMGFGRSLRIGRKSSRPCTTCSRPSRTRTCCRAQTATRAKTRLTRRP